MGRRRALAYITGTVDQEVLLRNESLTAENRILRAQIKRRLKLSDPERKTLAKIGKRLGRKALREVARIVTPDTILDRYRHLIAKNSDGPKKGRGHECDPLAESLRDPPPDAPVEHIDSSGCVAGMKRLAANRSTDMILMLSPWRFCSKVSAPTLIAAPRVGIEQRLGQVRSSNAEHFPLQPACPRPRLAVGAACLQNFQL
jgi:hypothetical protein